jgi:hypothetical protein
MDAVKNYLFLEHKDCFVLKQIFLFLNALYSLLLFGSECWHKSIYL